MTQVDQSLLINILGHTAGMVIFGIFLFLLYRGPAWPGVRGRALPAVAASLSMLWNVGSLVILTSPGIPVFWMNLIVAISFSLLSLLPAVLLQFSLQGRSRILTASGYLLSSAAVAMHFREIRGNGTALHQGALLVITIGFLMLTIGALAQAFFQKQPGGMRLLGSMCLALFATSFIHFGTGHASQAWSSELLAHHVGIPLALFLLLQDYRFVLLDAFVRFLVNGLLAALFAGALIFGMLRLAAGPQRMETLNLSILLVGVGILFLAFAWLRNGVQRWLTRAIFQQAGISALVTHMQRPPEVLDEAEYLQWAARTIAAAMNAEQFELSRDESGEPVSGMREATHAAVVPAARGGGGRAWAEAAVPVRCGPGDWKVVLLGRRQGGKRYLSEDLALLERAATEIAGHLETLRRGEMLRLVSQAELRALQSQINPHFLFNALNALYGTIPRQASSARQLVLNLAEIFRYFLKSDPPFVPLAREMEIVRAYLDVEQVRLGSRLSVEIELDDQALAVTVPVLSLQPLVENAIRHGVSQREEPGYVRLHGKVRDGELRITIENNGGESTATGGAGVGLENVQRRLEICYGAAAGLCLSSGAGKTTVEIRVPVSAGRPLAAPL